MSVFSASSRTASFKFFFFFFLQCLFTNLQVQDLQIQRQWVCYNCNILECSQVVPKSCNLIKCLLRLNPPQRWVFFVFFGRLLVPDFHGHW
jgi:hypothetical protein